MSAFPAKLVTSNAVTLIQKQRPFLFPLFTHSWHTYHLPLFFTQAERRGYVLAAFSDCRSCPVQAALLRSYLHKVISQSGVHSIFKVRLRGKFNLHTCLKWERLFGWYFQKNLKKLFFH